MSVLVERALRFEVRGGIEATLQGVSTLVTPSLMFVGLLGPLAGVPGLWGTLLAMTLVPGLRLLLGGSGSVIAAPRTASTATYVALVLHLGLAASAVPTGSASALLTETQLRMGLAAASLMYLLASVLVAFSGFIKLGRVFKMIPTPVTTGISNGTALLLVSLAAGKISDSGWVAALVALAMVLSSYGWSWLQNHSTWAKSVPAILMAIAIGLLGTLLFGLDPGSPEQAPPVGILAGTQWTSVSLWQSLEAKRMGALLMLGIPGAITLALVMVLETFTASSAMEIRFGVRSHADQELIAMGGANVLGALVGGIPCTGSPIFSVAAWQGGGRTKAVAWICYAVSGLVIVFFNPWIMVLPAGLAAGLLVLQALLMVNPAFLETLWGMARTGRWKKPGAQDMGFWIATVIALVGFFGNLIWACFAGVGLSCLAVLRRVSGNLMAQWAYLDAMRSRRIRTIAEADALTHLAHHVGVLRLTGHLFFGNSGRIMQLADELHADCVSVVIDVSQVDDVDPSGMDAMHWLLRTLLERRVRVVVAGLGKTRVVVLQAAFAALPAIDQRVDLDRGLETCENHLLRDATALPLAQDARPVESNGLLQGLGEHEITAVLLVADLRQVEKGAALFRKDERPDGVWMLQAGLVSILAGAGPDATRLATFGPGQFVGEMGFIDGNARSATVTADTAVSAVLLDKQALEALVQDHPQAALKITRNIARELAHRVRTTSAVLVQEASAPQSAWGTSVLGNSSK
jgi:SulP family sulfate permease